MGRKLEALTRNLTENQIALTVKDSAHQVWLAGLGAYAMAQDEGGRMFEALVKEGEVLETRTIKFTDAKIAFLTEKVAGSWDRIEREFESRVSRALGRLGVPNKKDVATLTQRVMELTEAVESLSEKQRVRRQVVAPLSDASADR